MQGPRTNDPRTWRSREWTEQRQPRDREPYGRESERGLDSPADRRGRAFAHEMHDPRTGERAGRPGARRSAHGAYDPYSGDRDDDFGFGEHHGGASRDYLREDGGYRNRTDDDDRYPAGPMQAADSYEDATPWERNVDTRFSGRGYHYPGGAYYPEESGRRDARRRAHFDEHRSWDPEDRDEFWRRGEYGSRLYGNVAGAATPIGTAGIRRYGAGGVERRGPKGYARSDERLHDDICVRLSNEPWLDLSEVEVHVKDGHVTLEGDVPDRLSKRAIEDIAEDAWGVKDVDNRIRVRAR